MPVEIKNLLNILKMVYFITQSPISSICWDIVQLGLLLGSMDPQTHVQQDLEEKDQRINDKAVCMVG